MGGWLDDGPLLGYPCPDSLSEVLETTRLVALSLYWIGIYFVTRGTCRHRSGCNDWSWRGIWVLPLALSIDNLTYGAVTGVPGKCLGLGLGGPAGAGERRDWAWSASRSESASRS